MLNRELQLGLFDFECHFAIYPAGTRYGRHLDRFKSDARRALSCVLYLNPDWREADGGQLRLYLDESHSVDVMPRAGTLVTFLSQRFEHEVLPATRERLSLAGWFRRRG
jgi:SM-20-related protein